MKKLEKKLRVGILGGTGMVGQRFITLLENHPWFEVTTIAASSRSAGKTYEEAMSGRWKLEDKMPEAVKNIVVKDVKDIEEISNSVDFVFSAVDMTKEEIKAIEDEYAKSETPVVSNNSAHRWTEDVPMVVPEINIDHFDIIETQKKRLGTKRGFVAVKPNCSIQGYVPALAAWQEFEPYEVCVTTYQAISGAGKNFSDWPEMVGNIIPYIGGEEEKSEIEPLKILGSIKDGKFVKADNLLITSQCVRVPILQLYLLSSARTQARKSLSIDSKPSQVSHKKMTFLVHLSHSSTTLAKMIVHRLLRTYTMRMVLAYQLEGFVRTLCLIISS